MNISQNQVYTSTAKGVPGQKASLNGGFAYYPNTLLAEGPVTVGRFVWPGSDPETLATNAGPVSAGPSGPLKIKPLGLVERNIVYPNYDPNSPGALTVPEGSPLAVATRGDFWAVANSDAVVGHKVFAVIEDGTITTALAGASFSAAVETDWVVVTAGQAGEPIIISHH